MFDMEMSRAIESLKAPELCLTASLINSAVSRACYTMFQAAQAALEPEGLVRSEWTHRGLHSSLVRIEISFINESFILERSGII
jgi:uncharacterized protein (UPF0332 family)